MDMREKLFPIFINEAAINIKVLQTFLQRSGASYDPQELESAFRAAHTLKGTAQLVRVDSVHQICQRFEALLEKHFSAQTQPTKVEYEAMELAVAWLAQILTELREGRTEVGALVEDALSALELVIHSPGETLLVELLDSDVRTQVSPNADQSSVAQGSPQRVEDLSPLPRDPFADDPAFDCNSDLNADGSVSDSEMKAADNSVASISTSNPDEQTNVPIEGEVDSELPFDMFDDDHAFFDDEDLPPEDVFTEPCESIGLPPSTEDPTLSVVDPADEGEVLSGDAPITDPFADDVSDVPVVEVASQSSVPEGDDSSNSSVESLLLAQEDVAPKLSYRCCCFSLAGNKYHLPIAYMLEIAEIAQRLPLPLAPSPIAGLVNLRGRVLPVIDMSTIAPETQLSDDIQRLVVAEWQGEQLAFLADGVPYLSHDFAGDMIDLPSFIEAYKIKGAEA